MKRQLLPVIAFAAAGALIAPEDTRAIEVPYPIDCRTFTELSPTSQGSVLISVGHLTTGPDLGFTVKEARTDQKIVFVEGQDSVRFLSLEKIGTTEDEKSAFSHSYPLKRNEYDVYAARVHLKTDQEFVQVFVGRFMAPHFEKRKELVRDVTCLVPTGVIIDDPRNRVGRGDDRRGGPGIVGRRGKLDRLSRITYDAMH
jgi:hypothetical protein